MSNYLVQQYLDNKRLLEQDKIAVSCNKESLTYHDLYDFSNKLANCLVTEGATRQDRVAFCLKRSLNSIVAIFGILKSDCIYVPIDSKSPINRMRQIIKDCMPRFFICDHETFDKVLQVIPDKGERPIIINLGNQVEFKKNLRAKIIDRGKIIKKEGNNPTYKNIDTDVAYILYTSGSTGNPKGVMISHLNIMNYVEWAVDCFDISIKDNILSTAPFHFDMSTFEIFCSVATGATLHIASELSLLFPKSLVNLIENEKITLWKGISSLLMYLAKMKAIKKGEMSSLKKIIFGGETLPTKYLIKWMKTFPEKQFYNAYGPTEATGVSMYYQVKQIPKDNNTIIPIGKPCSNTDAFLLKNDGSLAHNNEIGELCIRGSCLSRGYWNDQNKTDKVFIKYPYNHLEGDRIYKSGDLAKRRSDGNYLFIGRKDSQIKHMGYRIEISEIESAIISIDRVDLSIVMKTGSDIDGVNELVAFYESKENVTPDEIMKQIRVSLPHYMLPHHILKINEIPQNDRGKIDRIALKKYYLSHKEDFKLDSRVKNKKVA